MEEREVREPKLPSTRCLIWNGVASWTRPACTLGPGVPPGAFPCEGFRYRRRAGRSRLLQAAWVVLPAGCVLGNSVNHLELPEEVANRLSDQRGNLKSALGWLCDLLNDQRLDAWARAWAANNNVNNYELEMLPLPPSESALSAQFA